VRSGRRPMQVNPQPSRVERNEVRSSHGGGLVKSNPSRPAENPRPARTSSSSGKRTN
jgi:hypothetical protein